MQRGNIQRIRIPKASLAMALAHGGTPSAMLNIALPESVAAGRHIRSRLVEARLWSATQIQFGVRFFSKALGGDNTNLDLSTYLGEWSFGNSKLPGDGDQAVGDNAFYYYVPDLDISLQDDDMTGKLHFQVINWDAAADKPAAANLVIEFGLEPTQGW